MENEFQPDSLKEAQEVIFSRKRYKLYHPDIISTAIRLKKLLPKRFWYVS